MVFFEGVSCAGKTFLIEAIKNSNPKKIFVVPELPVEYGKIKNVNEFCRNNDERKCKVAGEQSKKGVVLVDRGYLSTLAYNYIQYKLGISQEYQKTISWYIKKTACEKLVKPDLYVFININRSLAIKRAKKLNRFNKSIAWYRDPTIANTYYKNFFDMFEQQVPLLEFNGEENLETMVNIFWKKVDEIERQNS